MIDIENAKKEFINYVGKYDINQKRIKLKYSHSFRVMEQSAKIAESLNLNKEEKDLATLIGLLHDIARFEQWKIYKTYSDKLSFDHGDMGVNILEKENFIRNFISDTRYDEIIKISIKNHNKFKIAENISDENTLMQAKIIRDADKLDIFYEAVEMFWNTTEEKEEIENSKITDKYFYQFMDRKQILREKNVSLLDSVICTISFIFDLNFEYSKKIVSQTEYIKKILNRFDFKNEETKKRMKEIEKIVDEFFENNR